MYLSIKLFSLGIFSLICISIIHADDQNNTFTDEELREMLFGDSTAEISPETSTPKSEWIPSYSGEFGVGYSDNPLYGPFVREDAVHLETSLEAFFMKQANTEHFSYIYLYGNGKVFEELSDHESSSIFLGQFDHAYTPLGTSQSYGLRLRHTYYDQGFDFSELGLPYSMRVRSNRSELIPYLSKKFSDQIKGTIELTQGFEDFKTIKDDNSDTSMVASISGKSEAIDWKITGGFTQKKYKTRPMRNADGSLLSAKSLRTEKTDLSVRIEKDFEYQALKNSSATIKWNQLQDNAGSYYDFTKFSLSIDQELKIAEYKVELNLGWAETKYGIREIDSGEKFERQSMVAGASLTRPLYDKFDAYFRWSHEEDFSNARDYEYFSNFWSSGVMWEF